MICFSLIISLALTRASPCEVDDCVYCSQTSPKVCLQCASGYELSISGCYLSESSNNFKISNCNLQESPEKCLSCNDGYHLSNNFCEADCFTHCVCFKPFECLENSNDKTLENRRRLSCGSSCYSCDYYYNECVSCYTGYYLSYGNCYSCYISNCYDCSSSNYCTSCNSGYYNSDGVCYSCSYGCETCDSYSYCYTCYSGYTLNYNNNCEKSSSSSGSGYSRTSSSNSSSNSASIAIGCSIGGFFFIMIIVICVACYVRRKRHHKFKSNHKFESIQHIAIQKPQDPGNQFNPQMNPGNQGYPQPYQAYSQAYSVYPQNQSVYPQAYVGQPIIISTTTPNQPPGNVINTSNFNYEVKIVTLDEHGEYLGQKICLFCTVKFSNDVETRILPCGHAFHSKCVYDAVAVGYNKYCPNCKIQYF